MPKAPLTETAMPEVFRERRKLLMRHLLRNKGGATIDGIARAIGGPRPARKASSPREKRARPAGVPSACSC